MGEEKNISQHSTSIIYPHHQWNNLFLSQKKGCGLSHYYFIKFSWRDKLNKFYIDASLCFTDSTMEIQIVPRQKFSKQCNGMWSRVRSILKHLQG